MNRLSGPAQYAIAPVDECYRLVGLVKTAWQGISGGPEIEPALAELLRRAADEGGVVSELGAASRSNGTAVVPEPEFEVVGASADEYAAAPTVVFSHPRTGAERPRGLHGRALDPDPRRPGAAAATTRRLARRSTTSSGLPTGWPRRCRASSGGRSRCSSRASPGKIVFDVPIACTYDLEVASAKYFASLAGRGRPARLPLQRDDLLPGGRGPAADRPRAVELHRPLPDARRRLAQGGGRLLRADGMDPAPRGDARAAAATADGARRAVLRRGRLGPARGGSSDSAGRPGLVSALRGLRALPLHAGRDEERDPDTVRDRLSRLRMRRGAGPPSTTCRCSACCGRCEAGGAGGGLLPPVRRRSSRRAVGAARGCRNVRVRGSPAGW